MDILFNIGYIMALEIQQIKTTPQISLAVLAKQLLDLIEDCESLINTSQSVKEIQALHRATKDFTNSINSEFPEFFKNPLYSSLKDRVSEIDIFILKNCSHLTTLPDHKTDTINFSSPSITDLKEPSTDFLITERESHDDLISDKGLEEKTCSLPRDSKSNPNKIGLLPSTDIAWEAIKYTQSYHDKGTSEMKL